MDRDDYSQQHNSHSHTHKASPTDLFSSAKVVAEAAQSAFRHDGHGYDKAKAAEAAADMLCAVSHYGKIEESSYGKYVEKAENYLHQYNPNHSSAPAAPATHESEDDGGSGGGYGDYMKMAQGFMGHSKTNSAAHEGVSEEEEGGGLGGYMKMAQGFMGHSGTNTTSHGKEDGGGGIGDYMKMAQGFMGHSSGRRHGEEEEEEEGGGGGGGGGGYGQYVKMAEGFMKKH